MSTPPRASGADTDQRVVVLERQEIVDPADRRIAFDFDPFQRDCILNGLDEIARSLTYEDGIAAYERAHPAPVDTLALAASNVCRVSDSRRPFDQVGAMTEQPAVAAAALKRSS